MSEPDAAVIEVDGHEIQRTRRVPVFAAFASDGRPLVGTPLEGPPWRVPFDRERFGLSRHAGDFPCVEMGQGSWTDVSRLAGDGRLGVLDVSGSGRLVFYAARERPLHPWLVRAWGGTAPTMSLITLDGRAVAASAQQDGVDASRLADFEAVTRIELRSAGARVTLASVDLGGIPTRLLARADEHHVRICRAPRGEGFFVTDDVDVEHINGRRSFFGDGWAPVEHSGGRDWRPLAQADAELLVGFAHIHALRVVVTASAGAAGAIALRINGQSLEPQHTTPGVADYSWTVPESWWKNTVNQIFLTGPPTLRIADVQFARSR